MLTDVQARKAKPGAKPYKLADGAGLHLFVTPAGGKLWRYRYEVAGKEKLHSIGSYPAVSLIEARAARDSAKATLREGKDPGVEKRQRRAAVGRATAALSATCSRRSARFRSAILPRPKFWRCCGPSKRGRRLKPPTASANACRRCLFMPSPAGEGSPTLRRS